MKIEEIKRPNLDRAKEVQKDSWVIGEFLEWLQNDSPYLLMVERTYIDEYDWETTDFFPTNDSIEKILAKYFNIDLKEMRREQDAVYKQLQEASKQDQNDGE